MNIFFMSLVNIKTLRDRRIYIDLLRELNRQGHHIYCVSPAERRHDKPTRLIHGQDIDILQLKIGNIQKTNIIEKGISTLLIEFQTIKAIKKYFSDVRFDLVLYPTPPITFAKAVEFVKKRDNAKSYLMLKDIFPQNSVDIGMMRVNSLLHRFFLRKERKLYQVSDYIGCMSESNVRYLLEHNPPVSPEKVELCPNAIEPLPSPNTNKKDFKQSYNIPEAATIFLYGGNLGKPQDIGFIIQCLLQNLNRADRFFIICGNGTEFGRLQRFVEEQSPTNMLLWGALPKDEYENMAACCDVGMIFLDHRFTIPNFPSRLLSYLENSLPVLACTDRASDIGTIAVENGFGWWCESTDAQGFTDLVDTITANPSEIVEFGKAGRQYLESHYTASECAEIILRHFE